MKYNISSDFKYIKFLTFPVVKAFAPIAHTVLVEILPLQLFLQQETENLLISADRC